MLAVGGGRWAEHGDQLIVIKQYRWDSRSGYLGSLVIGGIIDRLGVAERGWDIAHGETRGTCITDNDTRSV